MIKIINFFRPFIALLLFILLPSLSESAAIGEEAFQQRRNAVASRVDTIIKEWLSKEESTHPWMTEKDFDAFSLKAMMRHMKPYLEPTTLEKFEQWLRSTFSLDQWGASTLPAKPFSPRDYSVFTGMERITIFEYRPEYPKRVLGSKVKSDDPSLILHIVPPKTNDPKEINMRIEELLDMALNSHITTREIKRVHMNLKYDAAHPESGLLEVYYFLKLLSVAPLYLKIDHHLVGSLYHKEPDPIPSYTLHLNCRFYGLDKEGFNFSMVVDSLTKALNHEFTRITSTVETLFACHPLKYVHGIDVSLPVPFAPEIGIPFDFQALGILFPKQPVKVEAKGHQPFTKPGLGHIRVQSGESPPPVDRSKKPQQQKKLGE